MKIIIEMDLTELNEVEYSRRPTHFTVRLHENESRLGTKLCEKALREMQSDAPGVPPFGCAHAVRELLGDIGRVFAGENARTFNVKQAATNGKATQTTK